MKKLALAVAFATAGTAAFAGNLSEPVIEAPVVVEESSSSAGIAIPLLLLVVVAAALAD